MNIWQGMTDLNRRNAGVKFLCVHRFANPLYFNYNYITVPRSCQDAVNQCQEVALLPQFLSMPTSALRSSAFHLYG